MSITPLNVLLAAAPPLVVLILMVGFRWGGSKAGPAGWIVALALAILNFGAGAELLFYAHIRSLVLTADVVYIVWAALLLYLIVERAGALQVIADWFTNLTSDSMLRILLLGWVFTSFLQGVGGFGVPVAIVAPLLVGLGLSPLAAVVIPSVGHAWAVTFGSLGSSFIAMLGVTGLTAAYLGPPAALLLGIAAFGCGLMVAHAYDGWRGVRHALPAVLFLGAVMALGQYILVAFGLWNIGATGGALAGLLAGLWVTRWAFYRRADGETPPAVPAPETQTQRAPSFREAIAGYIVLVVLAILITGVEPIKALLGRVQLAVAIPEVQTSLGWVTEATPELGLKVLAHTGAVLIYSSLIAYWLYRSRGYIEAGAMPALLRGVRKGGVKPAIGILSMVAMATVMANAGMTRTLAEWMSQAVPASLYAFVAAAIGALGSFMTGSNTNSNAVFSTLQMDTAILLGLSVPMVLATQTAAAALFSLLAPAKIIVGASTVGMSGDEGTVLRHLLLYGGLLLLLVALLAFALLLLGIG